MKILPEFTKETGIEVEVGSTPLPLKCASVRPLNSPKRKAIMISPYVVFSKADYVYADQPENLAKYFMNPKLADPSYDADDLIDGYVYNIGFAGGEKGYLEGKTGSLFGIPYAQETSILGYRKDIFEKHGLKVPETYDEMLDLACKIPELEPGMGGVASHAASGHHASHAFLHPRPRRPVFDGDWNPIVNNEAGVKAAEALKKIVDLLFEGAASFGFGEALGSFLNGDTAMFLDTTVVAGQIDDPARSKVVGKVGWAMQSNGVRRGSQTGGFGIGIPANAENKEAAFFAHAVADIEKGDKLVAMAGGNPSRFSTHADAEVNAKFPHMSTFGEALKYVDPDWRPIIPVWGKINADLGTTLSKVLTEDLDIKEALDGVAERSKERHGRRWLILGNNTSS